MLWMMLTVLTVSTPAARGAEPQKAPRAISIPYATLEEALKALHANKSVTFRQQNGWLVAEDLVTSTVWLLTPDGHPAYPSIVRRTLVNEPTGAYFQTDVRCLASEEICDKYFGKK